MANGHGILLTYEVIERGPNHPSPLSARTRCLEGWRAGSSDRAAIYGSTCPDGGRDDGGAVTVMASSEYLPTLHQVTPKSRRPSTNKLGSFSSLKNNGAPDFSCIPPPCRRWWPNHASAPTFFLCGGHSPRYRIFADQRHHLRSPLKTTSEAIHSPSREGPLTKCMLSQGSLNNVTGKPGSVSRYPFPPLSNATTPVSLSLTSASNLVTARINSRPPHHTTFVDVGWCNNDNEPAASPLSHHRIILNSTKHQLANWMQTNKPIAMKQISQPMPCPNPRSTSSC
ncbi:hypothetical protein B0T10DRAFT_219904 [Thelonectria olida]|uniref:Uncharacterized protein n=1 Tax=Thelonectria olida TaxID=1576542 RepID=A0A9P9AW97_9HYPO|nr:hypothetical protein B0T10DRAFT_219904 [Thelonectria olida]